MAILLNQFYSIKKIKKELREFEKKEDEKKEYNKEKLEKRVPRIGILKADMNPDQEIKLSDELVGTLRQLVPEGNVLTDRLKVKYPIWPRQPVFKKQTGGQVFFHTL